MGIDYREVERDGIAFVFPEVIRTLDRCHVDRSDRWIWGDPCKASYCVLIGWRPLRRGPGFSAVVQASMNVYMHALSCLNFQCMHSLLLNRSHELIRLYDSTLYVSIHA
jgi:hypothetical protein